MVHGDIRLELAAKATAFSQSCEVVSLGCHGLVAMSLEALGLRRFHYPFDDVRSSMDDVIRLVETDFAYFPDSMTPDEGSPVTRVRREDMSVLVDRFLGRRSEVPLGKPRLFVRAVNSSREVEDAEGLRKALRRALPKARVYLFSTTGLPKHSRTSALRRHFGRPLFLSHFRKKPSGQSRQA